MNWGDDNNKTGNASYEILDFTNVSIQDCGVNTNPLDFYIVQQSKHIYAQEGEYAVSSQINYTCYTSDGTTQNQSYKMVSTSEY